MPKLFTGIWAISFPFSLVLAYCKLIFGCFFIMLRASTGFNVLRALHRSFLSLLLLLSHISHWFWGSVESAMVFYTRDNVNPSVNLEHKSLRYITCVLEHSRVRLEYELGKGPSETTGRGRKEGMGCE